MQLESDCRNLLLVTSATPGMMNGILPISLQSVGTYLGKFIHMQSKELQFVSFPILLQF